MYNKNQHILLLIQKLNPNKKALNHALKIANIFKSNILISNSPFSKNKIPDEDLENYISDHDNASTIQLTLAEDQPNKMIKKLNIIFMLIEIDEKNDFNRNSIIFYHPCIECSSWRYISKTIFCWAMAGGRQ